MPAILNAMDRKKTQNLISKCHDDKIRDLLLSVLETLVKNIEFCQCCLEQGVINKLDKTGLIHPCTDEQTLGKLINIYWRLCKAEANVITYGHLHREKN